MEGCINLTVPPPPGSVETIKADVAELLAVAHDCHRRGEDTFLIVQGLSDGIDDILRALFSQHLETKTGEVALVAVGGYGRRELCPHSDVDLLFLWNGDTDTGRIEKLVRLLWDGGFRLGHSVRTPGECYQYMVADHVTAAALLESRFIVGSKRLFSRFRSVALNRYRRRRGDLFAWKKLQQLRESLEEPGRTIYVLEPHLKEGPCCMRDIQRVLWVENIRRGTRTLMELGENGAFSIEQVARIREAYAFYLRLRCQLHFSNGLKQDILEPDSLVDIARQLGHSGNDREAGEALIAAYYRHARNVYRFLRQYLETGTQGRRFLTRLVRQVFATAVKPHLILHKGTLFLRREPKVEHLNEELVDIFVIAHRNDARLSEGLCEWIRRKAADASLDFRHSTVVNRALVAILRGGRNTGRILKAMHETGILGRILPEFGRLNGLVNFDGHHQFTVDEHTLRTLEELDRLESTPDDDGNERVKSKRAEFRQVFQDIKDPLPLRLALLLHDIGKGVPGKHAVSGGSAAILICERLGLEESTAQTVEFLVYRHLEMFKVSGELDFTEERVVDSLARIVGTEERLKMLYLLTFIDIVSVGPGTWTEWKGAQLSELYQRTLTCLRMGRIPTENLEESLAASELEPGERQLVLEHCSRLDSAGYVREIVPERMLYHVRLVKKLLESGRPQVGHDALVGYHEITFCCRDRPRLFADLAGVLLSEGFNVLGARIFSRSDGIAIDLFHVEIADELRVDVPRRVNSIRGKLRRVDSKEVVVEDLIRQRGRQYQFRRQKSFRRPLYGSAVFFDNESSSRSTIVQVRAGDRPGLLYDLATAISRLGLDVRTAKVSTLTTRAHDAFYVVEADGHKVSNPARMKEIEQTLVAAANNPSSALTQGGFAGG